MFNDQFGKLSKRVAEFFLKWDFGRQYKAFIYPIKLAHTTLLVMYAQLAFLIQLCIMAGLNFSEILYGVSWCLKHYCISKYPS